MRRHQLEQRNGLNFPIPAEAPQGLKCTKGKRRRSSSSRFTGVSWNKISSKWEASIFVNGQRRFLDYFTTEKAAAAAYDQAAPLGRARNFPNTSSEGQQQVGQQPQHHSASVVAAAIEDKEESTRTPQQPPTTS